MAGLRRITVCANPQLGDAGVAKLLEVLSDDLWIKGAFLFKLPRFAIVSVSRTVDSGTGVVIFSLGRP